MCREEPQKSRTLAVWRSVSCLQHTNVIVQQTTLSRESQNVFLIHSLDLARRPLVEVFDVLNTFIHTTRPAWHDKTVTSSWSSISPRPTAFEGSIRPRSHEKTDSTV